MKKIELNVLTLVLGLVLLGCGGTADILSTPVENIDNTPLKVTDLTEDEMKTWGHLDLVADTIPGMSVNKAYDELLKGKKGVTTIVAIIDSGIDIDHEDLDDVIWRNKDEVPNNGKDDDKNGFIDDVHGWNFLGDTYDEQMEYVRLLASGNTAHPRYLEAKAELEKEYNEAMGNKTRYEQILQQIKQSDVAVAAHLKKKDYNREEVNAIKTEDQTLLQHVSVIKQTYGFGIGTIAETITELNDAIEYFTERLNYHFNKDFKGRKNGDDPNDFSSIFYGNNNVKPIKKSESHGTHVAGIVAAERDNGKGVNGVASNVKIMPVRAVPNGDEYDKDVALAIRYAVDNGARIINTSFGKYYSPHSDKVRDAIRYAAQKDVLIVNAAGNEGIDVDTKDVFPNDTEGGKEISDNFITVGALVPKYGSGMVASYSNYGKNNVDVFAPGSSIYSTIPENEYKSQPGTSMAAPAVAGIAALIRSHYPKLSASQVKQILIESGLAIKSKVVVGGNSQDVRPFEGLSKSGKIVNAYNAIIMAAKMSKVN
ncbi:MAG: S8 family serine peptidase [Bacteroidia bacterium]|nr:S8 family serine peptidase [Bacteroidia bacterium]NNK72589.1 S8 family serine peptidase [Flavobacteriaceae bacterium]